MKPRLRLFLFGSAAAAAAMAFPQPARPTSCLTGPFMVFFEPDSDELVGQAPAILDNAAAAFQGQICGVGGPIYIAGHADRSGSDSHNISLSKRRAESVRAYLAGRGLPDKEMVVYAYGERRPLVETPDAVPEAQNRRVEIRFGDYPSW